MLTIYGISAEILLTGVIAFFTVLGSIAGGIAWLQTWRWRDVRSILEEEEYMQERFEGSRYVEGRISATVTNINAEEKSGIRYRIWKSIFATISGSTKVTMRLDGIVILDDRLQQEPFITLFSNPSDAGLVDAEHLSTEPHSGRGYTTISIEIHSLEYESVGKWVKALPYILWSAYEKDQELSQ